MFSSEECLEIKGIHKSINLSKINTNIKMYLVRFIADMLLCLA